MKNITITELQEEQLDNINAASARSFFKKIGRDIGKGLKSAGSYTKDLSVVVQEGCKMAKDALS